MKHIKKFELVANTELVNEFLNSISSIVNTSYKKRDNCGPAAIDFLDWIISYKKINGFKKVRGVFNSDIPVSEKLDFDKNLKSKFNMTSLDFNKDSDRKKFINSLPDKKRFTRIAHYWAISPDGEIHDPTGMYQFYDTGLSEDLNRDRYEPI